VNVNRAELALTASRTKLLAEQLSDVGRDLLIREWADLLDTLDSANPGTGELVLIEFRRSVEERLSVKQLHAPLVERVRPVTR
jgi:hypothetical protein